MPAMIFSASVAMIEPMVATSVGSTPPASHVMTSSGGSG
jgi:hypothetical protein